MIQFKGFKPQAMQRIAGTLGYQGDMSGFNNYLNNNPDKKQKMDMYQQKAVQMLQGGLIKMQQGGSVDKRTLKYTDLGGGNFKYQILDAAGNEQQSGTTTKKYIDSGLFGSDTASKFNVVFGDSSAGAQGSTSGTSDTSFLVDGVDTRFLPSNKKLVDGKIVDNSLKLVIPDTPTERFSLLSGVKQPIDFDPKADPRGVPVQDGPDLRDATQYLPQNQTPTPPQQPEYQGESITELQAQRALDPSLPYGATVQPVGTQVTSDQIIDPSSGQVTGDITTPITTATTAQADMPDVTDAAKMDAAKASDQVATTVAQTTAAQGQVDPRAIVDAQQATSTSVSDLEAAQGKAVLMDNPVQRKVEAGELVSSVSNAATAAKFTEEIQAAQATPTKQATVQGQLETLMQQFEGGNTPAWAAGAMRNVTGTMAARGLGASSIAGQALVQAAMESALPIAQADAATVAQFEAQNLSNRQQRAMLAAEQRATFLGQEFDQEFQTRVLNASKISDIANMNFTADQQVQLENARSVQTMNLENLSNRQAMVLAEASALANLDMGNLNNRQQTAVQNAQNFLQLDMANLSNEQQTELFKSQQVINSMLTDQAAVNASRQFNAQSENQANQFYDNLNSTINMHNSEQQNAQERFNSGQVNAANQFNAEMKNNREQFNAQNQLVVDQSNATWRREIATQDTAAINRANELNAINTLDISNTAYNNMWGLYGDQMEWAWTSAENQQERLNELAQEQLSLEERKMEIDAESSKSFGNLVSTLLFTDMSTLSKTFAGSLF